MTTEGSSEHADSERDDENAEVEEPSAAEVEEPEDEPEAGSEVADVRPPRTTRDVTGTPLMKFAGIDTGDMLGIGKVVSDIQRSMVPDMQQNWQKELLPVIANIQRNLVPEIALLQRNIVPSMQALVDTLVPAMANVHSTVQLSGVTSFLDTFQARHQQMMKDLFPGFTAASVLGPLSSQMSEIANILSTSALQDMTPTLTLAAEVAVRLTEVDEQLDEEQLEEVAVQVGREVNEDYDPDLPPTPEQMAATEALVKLLVTLRPDLSDDPLFRRRVSLASGGGGLLATAALIMSYPPAYAVISALFVALSVFQVFQSGADRLIAPGAYKKNQDPDSEE